MVAYDFPILSAFLTILWFFLFVIWIWLLITVFVDIFRSHDLSGVGKAAWFLFVLLIPLVGVVVYLIARGSKMHERAVREQEQQEKAFRSYVRSASGDGSAGEVARLADLRDRGVITEQEFQQGKAKALR